MNNSLGTFIRHALAGESTLAEDRDAARHCIVSALTPT
jgi:hypothetical protein